MRKSWLRLGVTLLVAVLAIGVVACSDDDDGGDDTPTATERTDRDDVAKDGDEVGDDDATIIVTLGILTDSAGNTLYILDNDAEGVSNCAEGCADIWPPFSVDGGATAGEGVVGVLGTITRDDGSTQVTYDDQPLYYYAADEAPGDRNGNAVGGTWHIVELFVVGFERETTPELATLS